MRGYLLWTGFQWMRLDDVNTFIHLAPHFVIADMVKKAGGLRSFVIWNPEQPDVDDFKVTMDDMDEIQNEFLSYFEQDTLQRMNL